MSVESLKPRPPVLSVKGVTKNYHLHRSIGARFLYQLLGPLSPLRPSVFPAVRDVSFELFPGEAVAVLGRNGAGKSTLLQMISDLMEPTIGKIELPPRVIGLLELGSGFNPEFTGRENIRINAAILGLSRQETSAKLDEIIQFAEIGDYIDREVRTYSSGMFLRLAFAVATAAAPDLLLIDEVLAVGDIFFRQKCYERLRALREAGTAIVLVTHSLTDASEFCDRGVVLSEGTMAFYGDAGEAVEYYMHHERDARTGTRAPRPMTFTEVTAEIPEPQATADWISRPGAVDLSAVEQVGDPGAATIDKLFITDTDGKPGRVFRQGEWARIHVAFTALKQIERPLLGVAIRNDRNILVHGKNNLNTTGETPSDILPGTRLELTYEVKLDLDYGEYTLDVGIADIDDRAYRERDKLMPDDLAPHIRLLRSARGVGAISIILQGGAHPATFSHYGIADLPSRHLILAQGPVPMKVASSG
jgi:lipopolysaccharide transport system ATP-binding protein